MMSPAHPDSSVAAVDYQPTRLLEFLRWGTVAAGLMAALELGTVLFRFKLELAIFGVANLGLLALLHVARALVHRRRPVAAVVVVNVGLMTIALVDVLVTPKALPVAELFPLIGVAVALPYVDRRTLLRLSGAVWALVVLLAVVSRTVQLIPPQAGSNDTVLVAAMVVTFGMIVLLLWQFSSRLTENLAQTQAANTALRGSQAALEQQVAERTAALTSALADVAARADAQSALVRELEQHRHTIRDLSVPVLPISDTTLVVPLVGLLDAERLHLLQQRALEALEAAHAETLILDITGVPVVVDEVAAGLCRTVAAGQLLGAELVLVGVRPEVAQTIVATGLSLQQIQTFRDLRSALHAARPGRRAHGRQQAALA